MGLTNMTSNLGEELIELNNTVDAQRFLIVELKLKAAMYKAYFFGESDLAERLEKQIEENHDNVIGEYDGFCYSSERASAIHRNLRDMLRQGIITESEYQFCKV